MLEVPRLRVWLVVVCLLGVATGAGAQPVSGNAVVVNPTPMFLTPDSSRTPLATLPAGTRVRALAPDGEWYRIIYRDRYLGDRTGYVKAIDLRVEGPPTTQGTPPGMPGLVNPATAPGTPQPIIVQSTPMKAASPRTYVSLNGSYQQKSTAFTAATTFTQNVEQGTATTAYRGVHFPIADAGAGFRVAPGVLVGGAVTWLSHSSDADVSASIPHPFTFNTPRSVSGVASGIGRQELALHVSIAYITPEAGRTHVMIFGGPSFFRVKQGLVTNVNANEVYPYDTATFKNAVITDASKSRAGGHVGADVSFDVWNGVGVGAIARFSRANIDFASADGTSVAVKAGGLQVGGGLRFKF